MALFEPDPHPRRQSAIKIKKEDVIQHKVIGETADAEKIITDRY